MSKTKSLEYTIEKSVVFREALTKAYLYHLDKCGEILGARLNTIHNLRYYQRLMAEIRQAIEDDRFDDFVVEFYARMGKPVPPLQLADKS